MLKRSYLVYVIDLRGDGLREVEAVHHVGGGPLTVQPHKTDISHPSSYQQPNHNALASISGPYMLKFTAHNFAQLMPSEVHRHFHIELGSVRKSCVGLLPSQLLPCGAATDPCDRWSVRESLRYFWAARRRRPPSTFHSSPSSPVAMPGQQRAPICLSPS